MKNNNKKNDCLDENERDIQELVVMVFKIIRKYKNDLLYDDKLMKFLTSLKNCYFKV